MDSRRLEHQDVVIHLSGENISAFRWSKEKKRKIRESRVGSTAFLSDVIAHLKNPPSLLMVASAVGFYGSSLEKCDESISQGTGFLAQVVADWEKATESAKKIGIRVIHMRFGVVIGTQGGMLVKVLPLYRWGLGGIMGNGTQVMSWIALEEIPELISFMIQHQNLSGPINVVSPNSVTNQEFTHILATKLHRPALFHTPAFILKLLMGEMANETILSNTHAVPRKLIDAGYEFKFPTLLQTLEHLL